MGLSLMKSCLFKMLGFSFSSKLDCISCILSLVNMSLKYWGLDLLYEASSLCLYKSTIRPCMGCCCHVQAGASNFCLGISHELQKWVCSNIVPTLASFLEPAF